MAASQSSPSFLGEPALDANPQQSHARDAAAHQRTYQACIPCRQRKVRCDLGSVDSPHDPPCLRCRRESKECYFSATRRKKKGDVRDSAAPAEEVADDTAYITKPGRKRLRTSAARFEEEEEEDDVKDEEYLEPPRTPGGSVGRLQPLRRPDASKHQPYGEDDFKASEETTAILQGAEVHGGHDALKVLYEAAFRRRPSSTTSNGRPNITGPSPSSLPAATSPIVEKSSTVHHAVRGPGPQLYPDPTWKTKLEPVTIEDDQSIVTSVDPAAYASAINAWSRFKFVRAGWFTPKEAIAYIAYFYKYLCPLTAVTLPDFQTPEKHHRLLTQEPMLTVTILVIASRHMQLEGPGSMTRPYTIHQKLWTYLQGMVDRVVWGQEQFGGSTSQPGCDVNPLTRKGLRTLGTVESLMLLTEWHPRAMHFPPDEADSELMVSEEPTVTPGLEASDDNAKGIGGQRMDSWLEPCWRSDRMCWMLLGMAMSLAFEIGVFDKSEWQVHALSTNGQPLSPSEMQEYDRRRGNVRDLLLVHVTLTSGRLGLTSMLPSNYSKPEDSDLYKTHITKHDSIQEMVLQFWLRIAAIMRDGNQKIFPNKAFTRNLIQTGKYTAALEEFRKPLMEWRRDFDSCVGIPKFMRHVLEIEYEYCRVYLSALALQAVAERCANDVPRARGDQSSQQSSRTGITTNGVRTDVAIDPQTLAKWLGQDRQYMNEVRDAACNLLSVVVKGLHPGEYLKHAPVRTYFRIISVAIILLKSFSLGASAADVVDSLKLMDLTVEALRTCIVDDVHVASRFADLLDILTQNLKPRLIRISADGRGGRSQRQSIPSTPFNANEQPVDIDQALHAQNPGQQYHHQQNPHTSVQAQPGPWSQNDVFNSGNNGYGPANPLFGISSDSYDLFGTSEYSVMPPPSFPLQSPNNSSPNNAILANTASTLSPGVGGAGHHVVGSRHATDQHYGSGPEYNNGVGSYGVEDMQDWFALPLDPLLAMPGADVNQTMYGPELGGTDMLELLLNGHTGFQ